MERGVYRLLAMACLLVFGSSPVRAVEVEGVHIDDRARVAGTDLVLNGAGIRKRFVVSVYAAGLYLPERRSDAAGALALPGPKRMALVMMRDVTSEQLLSSLVDRMKANNPPAELEKLAPRIDRFAEIMRGLNGAKKGETIVVDFVPATGLSILVNGKVHGSPIPGEDFERALLKAWLGDEPADASLKKALLGQ